MKIVFSLLISFFTLSASASSISMSCSNASGTIVMSDYSSVKIITTRFPKEEVVLFDLRNDVELTIKEKMTVAVESGCASSDATSVQKILLKRKDGEKMPSSYSKNVNKDGTLSDVLICNEARSWMPMPGQCK